MYFNTITGNTGRKAQVSKLDKILLSNLELENAFSNRQIVTEIRFLNQPTKNLFNLYCSHIIENIINFKIVHTAFPKMI